MASPRKISSGVAFPWNDLTGVSSPGKNSPGVAYPGVISGMTFPEVHLPGQKNWRDCLLVAWQGHCGRVRMLGAVPALWKVL